MKIPTLLKKNDEIKRTKLIMVIMHDIKKIYW